MTSVVIIGIDLGTTNTCLGYIKNGHLHLIDNEDGSYQTPSVITYTDDTQILIGPSALENSHKYPDEFLYEVKRLIGQSSQNPKVQEDMKRFSYKVEDDLGLLKIIINNDYWNLSLYPEEISALIIKNMLNMAETRLEEPINEAVITVPAYFGDDQRTATKDAALLAGLQKVHLINEPTAAALAFQHSNKKDDERNILVYDFGGGTFDVSIVQTRGYNCKVLATDGDCHLGGTDIDINLVHFMMTDIYKKHKESITKSDARRLRTISERIKKNLSVLYKYSIDIPLLCKKIDYELHITRQQFEQINKEIFEKTLQIVERCIGMTDLNKNQIDEVVLVGGSTRIPKIREMLKEYFGKKKINISRNPDELVAYGAAVHAECLYENEKEVFTIQDVLSLSLGTDVVDDEMSIIIKRNTPVPCKRSRKYATVCDKQTVMDIKIYQGEKFIASENTLLGDFAITDLTLARKGKVLVKIKLIVDAEGILSVTAKEINTKNKKTLNIKLKKQRRPLNKSK